MRLTEDTITLYNNFTNEKKEKDYLPTVIKGVHWFGTEQVSVTSDGLVSAKQYTIRIPVDADFSGKAFVTPKEYARTKDRGSIFTLNEGDTIVKGEVSTTGPASRPSALQKAFDSVVTVLSVTDNRSAPNAKHWKVTCK